MKCWIVHCRISWKSRRNFSSILHEQYQTSWNFQAHTIVLPTLELKVENIHMFYSVASFLIRYYFIYLSSGPIYISPSYSDSFTLYVSLCSLSLSIFSLIFTRAYLSANVITDLIIKNLITVIMLEHHKYYIDIIQMIESSCFAYSVTNRLLLVIVSVVTCLTLVHG